MKYISYNPPTTRRQLTVALLMSITATAGAKCGACDYTWGADGLYEATNYLGTMLIYTVDILYAVAAIMVVVFNNVLLYFNIQKMVMYPFLNTLPSGKSAAHWPSKPHASDPRLPFFA